MLVNDLVQVLQTFGKLSLEFFIFIFAFQLKLIKIQLLDIIIRELLSKLMFSVYTWVLADLSFVDFTGSQAFSAAFLVPPALLMMERTED